MKLQFDCLPCIFNQVLDASRMVTNDCNLIKEILDEYAKLVPNVDSTTMGPTLGAKGQQIVKEKSGVSDPYSDFKAKHMELAQKLYPEVESIVAAADDSLFAALIMSAMGNAIDAGISLDVDVEENMKKALEHGFVESDFNLLEDRLEDAQEVLILGDNSGEAIFDQLLIQELKEYGLDVIYAYRDLAILNDVSIKEVREIGIDKLADRVLSSGCQTPGTILADTTTEFREIYEQADIVISKGQGNFEGLSEAKRDIFFLLKAKCEIVADLLEVEQGDLIFKLN